jgi:uncharacterized membrane protein
LTVSIRPGYAESLALKLRETIVIRPILLGAVAGMRSMLPLAALSYAARHQKLTADSWPGLLRHELTGSGLLMLAAGELLGDKWRAAPDRISAAGLAARVTTGALCGAVLAPAKQRRSAAVLGAAAAVAAGYVSFALRIQALKRFGRVPTGVAEDAIALAATLGILGGLRRRSGRHVVTNASASNISVMSPG